LAGCGLRAVSERVTVAEASTVRVHKLRDLLKRGQAVNWLIGPLHCLEELQGSCLVERDKSVVDSFAGISQTSFVRLCMTDAAARRLMSSVDVQVVVILGRLDSDDLCVALRWGWP